MGRDPPLQWQASLLTPPASLLCEPSVGSRERRDLRTLPYQGLLKIGLWERQHRHLRGGADNVWPLTRSRSLSVNWTEIQRNQQYYWVFFTVIEDLEIYHGEHQCV